MPEIVQDEPTPTPEDPDPRESHPMAGLTHWADGRPRSERHLRLGNTWLGQNQPHMTIYQEKRKFIEMIVGAPNSQEQADFALSIRNKFINGTLAPAIAVTVLHLWLGKPKETIEVREAPPDYAELTDEQLAARASMLAAMLHEQNTIDVPRGVDPDQEPRIVLTRPEDLSPPRLVKKT